MVLKSLIVRSFIKFLFLVAQPQGVELDASILVDSESIALLASIITLRDVLYFVSYFAGGEQSLQELHPPDVRPKTVVRTVDSAARKKQQKEMTDRTKR